MVMERQQEHGPKALLLAITRTMNSQADFTA
jgi:hypothetical protein